MQFHKLRSSPSRLFYLWTSLWIRYFLPKLSPQQGVHRAVWNSGSSELGTKSEAACPSGHNSTASCLLRRLSESVFYRAINSFNVVIRCANVPWGKSGWEHWHKSGLTMMDTAAWLPAEASKQVFMVYLLENVILWSGEVSKGTWGCRGTSKNNRKTGERKYRDSAWRLEISSRI